MIPLPSVEGRSDILEEARVGVAADLASPALERLDPRAQLRGITPTYPLSHRMSPENRLRLQDLTWLESVFEPNRDRCPAITVGACIVESECIRLILQPARRLREGLLAVAKTVFKDTQIEALEEWLDGRLPATLGMAEIVLCALGYGEARDVAPIKSFLASRFQPAFTELLRSGGLQRALSRLRTGFRNPAAHGLRRFSPDDYREFCLLAVAARTFRAWDERGPERATDPDTGVLHHHLDCCRESSSPAVQNLVGWMRATELSAAMWTSFRSLDSEIKVDVLTNLTAPGSRSRRIGTPLQLSVVLGSNAVVTLLEFGSDGAIRVLSRGDVLSAVYNWPFGLVGHDGQPLQAFVSGPPGIERILAIATTEPLQPPATSSSEPARFVDLTQPEAVRLHRVLQSLPPAALGIGAVEFEVVD